MGRAMQQISSDNRSTFRAHVQGEMPQARAALPQPGDHVAVSWRHFHCRPHAGVRCDPVPSAAHPRHWSRPEDNR